MERPETVVPLSTVPPGRRATVVVLSGGMEFQSRLVNMGLNVGSMIEVIHNSRYGGPTLVATGESRLGVGYGMARRIMVAVDPPLGETPAGRGEP